MYTSPEKNIKDKVTNDVNDGTRRVKDDLRDAAGNVKHDLEDLARHAGQQAREFVGTAEQNVVNAAESVTAKIYDNPIQSSLISLAVGVFLGMAFFRRS